MCEISVVIPVRDEEKNVADLALRITQTLSGMSKTFEVIFVTDVNRDKTVDALRQICLSDPRHKFIKLSNCFGQHVAVMAGLDHSSGDYIVIMDGDLQDCPEDIPQLYQKITSGYDIVYGIKSRKNDNLMRNVASRIFNALMGVLSDIKLQSNSNMFRIISRKAKDEIIKFREFEPSLTYIFAYINLPTTTVVVQSGVRSKGASKYGLWRLINFALSSLMSFSRKPLRLIALLGTTMSFFSFLFFIVILYLYVVIKFSVPGWATIVCSITFIGGIQLLCLGIIGEYVGRMYMQTKNRPMYIIEAKQGDLPKNSN